MTTIEQTAGTARKRSGSVERAQGRIGLAFAGPYTLFLLVFGILPVLYAIYLAFTKKGAFVGFANFLKVFKDYRFLPAVEHVGVFLAVWLVMLVILVVVLALLVHSIGIRWLSGSMRFVYYIPGALAGASSVMLWLFVLDPSVSPVSWVLRALGIETFVADAVHDLFARARRINIDRRLAGIIMLQEEGTERLPALFVAAEKQTDMSRS